MIISTLPDITLVKNPGKVEIEKFSINSTEINFSAIYKVDNTISTASLTEWTFNWSTIFFVRITFSSLGLSGNDFRFMPRVSDFGGDYLLWGQKFVETMQLNNMFNDYYSIELLPISNTSAAYFKITALNPGSEYDLNLTSSATAPIIQTSTLGNVIGNKTYYAVCKIYMESFFGANDFTEIAKLKSDGLSQESGLMRYSFFDIPQILRKKLQINFPENPFVCTKSIDNIKRYYFVISFYPNNFNPYDLVNVNLADYYKEYKSEVKIALLAGTDIENNDYEDFFFPYPLRGINQAKFLTTRPEKIHISYNQPDYLSFLYVGNTMTPTAGFTGLQLKTKVYYDDSSISDYSTDLFILEAGLYNIPTGYTNHAQKFDIAGKKIMKYEVYVGWATNALHLSDTYYYFLDQREFQFQNYFHFGNSLSGIDTLRCKGYSQYDQETKEIAYETVRTYRSSIDKGLTYTDAKTDNDLFVSNTGFLTIAENNWINEFFISESIVQLYDILQYINFAANPNWKQNYKSIRLTSSKYKRDKDGNKLWNLDFSYQNVWIDNSHIAKPLPQNKTYNLRYTATFFRIGLGGTMNFVPNTNSRVYWNNKLMYKDGTTYIPAYPFVQGSNTVEIETIGDTILLYAGNSSLTITSIKDFNFKILTLKSLVKINDFFILNHIPDFGKMEVFEADTIINVDDYLMKLLELKLKYNVLTTITITGASTAPSGLGLIAKSDLISLGVTVNTN